MFGYLLLLMMRNDRVCSLIEGFEDQQGVGCTFLVDRLPAPPVFLALMTKSGLGISANDEK